MMRLSDPNTRDLSEQKLALADDLLVWPVHERGKLVYRVEVPSQHRFYRIGYEEYVLISLLDGNTTIPQACGMAAAKLGKQAPTTAAAESVARWLLANQIAYLGHAGPPASHATSSATEATLERLNPFWIKWSLPQSQRWMGAIADKMRSVFRPSLVAAGICLIFLATVILACRWSEFAGSTTLIDPANWIYLAVTWLALKIVHEFAHAGACHYHGGRIGQAGLVLILFAPMAFVDVTSCWRMNSRWSRMGVSAAGMYAELVIAALALILWATIDDSQLRHLMHNTVLAAGVSTLLFNANPLMRFDGYYLLADCIDVPNLWSQGSQSVGRALTRLAGGQAAGRTDLQGWRKPFVLLYGIAALLWRVVVCSSLLLAASKMFAGAGIVITAIGILLWVGKPTQALLRRSVDLFHSRPAELRAWRSWRVCCWRS